MQDDALQGRPNRNFDGKTVEAPEAGEIEWAGALVKKAPGAPTA